MNKIKEVFTDRKLYVFVIITLLFFGVFAKIQYAPDTYYVFTKSTRRCSNSIFFMWKIYNSDLQQ